MDKKEFNNIVLANFPEVKPIYLKEVKDFWEKDEPGATIVVFDYLMSLVYEALAKKDESFLKRFGLWVEKMVAVDDNYCRNVIFLSVFEESSGDGRLEELKRYFGKETMKFLNETTFV